MTFNNVTSRVGSLPYGVNAGKIMVFIDFNQKGVDNKMTILQLIKKIDKMGVNTVFMNMVPPPDKANDLIEALISVGKKIIITVDGTEELKCYNIPHLRDKMHIICVPTKENLFDYNKADEFAFLDKDYIPNMDKIEIEADKLISVMSTTKIDNETVLKACVNKNIRIFGYSI